MTKEIIAVWFSCGAASAVAAYLTVQKYGATHDVRILNNPVKEEHEDNLRFLKDVEAWIGVPIERITHSKFPNASAEEVWDRRKAMVFPHGAPCTGSLKKAARQEWEKNNKAEWHVLGFTVDEEGRHDNFVLTERDNVLPILIDAGLTKQDCYDMLVAHGVQPSVMYALGYPNANCIGCVKATSPTYWNHVRKTHPEVFLARAEQSRRLNVRLVRYQGKRIFLDELPPEAVGRPMKEMNIECSSFCEENVLTPSQNKLLTFKTFNHTQRENDVDIKISLEIGLSPALESFLGKVLGGKPSAPERPAPLVRETTASVLDEPDVAAVVEAAQEPDPQPEAQRRTRRTKAQMEADAAAAASTGSLADLTDAGSAATATDLADALDAGEADTSGAVTKDTVTAKLREAMGKIGAPKLQAQMIERLDGAKNMSTLPPENYAAAVALFDEIIAG